MVSGDLTASTPTFAATEAAIETAVNALNLAAVTDFIMVIPWRDGALVFKIEREA